MAGDADTSDHVDYRFTLANERTFLAWVRTALALPTAAVALVQFAPDLGSEDFGRGCAAALTVPATGCAVGGLLRWLGAERALGEGWPLRCGYLALGLGRWGSSLPFC